MEAKRERDIEVSAQCCGLRPLPGRFILSHASPVGKDTQCYLSLGWNTAPTTQTTVSSEIFNKENHEEESVWIIRNMSCGCEQLYVHRLGIGTSCFINCRGFRE